MRIINKNTNYICQYNNKYIIVISYIYYFYNNFIVDKTLSQYNNIIPIHYILYLNYIIYI